MRGLMVALAVFASTCGAMAAGTLPYANVLDYGVAGNGTTDDHAAIMNVFDNVVAERGTVYFPGRHYYVGQTLDLGGRAFNLRGDGRGKNWNTYTGGTFLQGSFAGPILRSVYPAAMLSIQDMEFSNWHAEGLGLLLSGSHPSVSRVSVNAYRGIEMAPSTFSASLEQIAAKGLSGSPAGAVRPGSVGISSRGHTLLHGFDVVGFDAGVRICGVGNDLRSGRIEVNRIGIELGVLPDGTNWALTASTVESLSLEANDYGIVARNVTSSSIRDVLIQGSTNAPTDPVTLVRQSEAGLVVNHSQGTSYEQVISSGTFSEASIKVSTMQPTTVPVVIRLCRANNTYPGAALWSLPPTATHPLVLVEHAW